MEYLLSNAPINKQLKITKILDVSDKLLHRFSELGIIIGQKVTVMCSPTSKSRVICIRGYTLALDITLCQRVVVYG